MNFPSSLIFSSRTWVAIVSSGAVATGVFSFTEFQNTREKDYHNIAIPLFHSPHAPDLFYKWKHLKNDEVDMEEAFEIGKTKLPVKPIPTLFVKISRDFALPSVFEKERNTEISSLQLIFHQFVDSPGYDILKQNFDKKGCQKVFSYNPENIRILNKLLATLLGALANDPLNADLIIMELKKYEDMAKVVRNTDRSVGRGYSKELLRSEDLCEFCKNALPNDERCYDLFFPKRPLEHRKRTIAILEDIEQRRMEKGEVVPVVDISDEGKN